MKENYTMHNIRNNLELIEGLDKLEIKSNDKLISLDVTNMLREIPKEPLLELLHASTATIGIQMV